METSHTLTDLLQTKLGDNYGLYVDGNKCWIGAWIGTCSIPDASIHSLSRWLFHIDGAAITGIDTNLNPLGTRHLSDPDLINWMIKHVQTVLG